MVKIKVNAGRKDPLARAVGLKSGQALSVVDATAGLGRDAFFLASLGVRVTMIERVGPVFAALSDHLKTLRSASEGADDICDRLEVLRGDSITLLPTLTPEVVLIDPMHPPRSKSALVKKEMRDLRAVVGQDEDAGQLIRVALSCARNRVVIKWPRKAALPEGLPKPSHQIIGKTVRYDVFMATARTES
jgi:16S rRNA (guanine1516-N2)-methyltransferase